MMDCEQGFAEFWARAAPQRAWHKIPSGIAEAIYTAGWFRAGRQREVIENRMRELRQLLISGSEAMGLLDEIGRLIGFELWKAKTL